MNSIQKLSLLIISIFVVSFAIFTFLIFTHTQHTIKQETSAAMEQAKALLSTNLSGDQISTILSNSPHLQLQRISGRLNQQANSDELMFIPIAENQFMMIATNPSTEMGQQLNVYLYVAGLFVTVTGALFVLIVFSIKTRLAPVKAVADALANLSIDNTQPIAKSDVREINTLVSAYEKLLQQLKQKQQALTASNQLLSQAEENERRFLASELHDNVGQLLTTMKAHCFLLKQPLPAEKITQQAEFIDRYSEQISHSIRQITQHLHPLMFDKMTFMQAIDKLIVECSQAFSHISITSKMQWPSSQISHDKQSHIYRIIQEALNNALKHAAAQHINVHIHYTDEIVIVEVIDDGCGFHQDTLKTGLGLHSFENRVKCINGTLTIQTGIGEGTRVAVTFPLDKSYENIIS